MSSLLSLLLVIFSTLVEGQIESQSCVTLSNFSDYLIEIPSELARPKGNLSVRLSPPRLVCSTKWIPFEFQDPNLPITGQFDRVKFYRDGNLEVNKELYYPAQFCLFPKSGSSFTGQYCAADCRKFTCVPKCCSFNKVFDIHSKGCVPSNVSWLPRIYEKSAYKGCGTEVNERKLHFLLGKPCQSRHVYFRRKVIYNGLSHTGTRFRILKNGDVAYQEGNEWKIESSKQYCADAIQNYENSSEFRPYDGNVYDEAFYVCADDEYETGFLENGSSSVQCGAKTKFLAGMLIVCAVFNLMTGVIYMLTWERTNLHNWTVFSFVMTMMTFYSFLASVHLVSCYKSDDDIGGTFSCRFISMATNFLFISTFAWMTALSFNFWITFQNLSPNSQRKKSLMRFRVYSFVSWGCPLIIVLVGHAIDEALDSRLSGDIVDDCEFPVVAPRHGKGSCFLQGKAKSYYIYLPITILMACNILLYASTVYLLYTYRRKTASVNVNKQNSQKQSILLYTKLFFVNGLFWIFEIIQWPLGEAQDASSHHIIWIILDCINLLQSFLIFVIFALKKENVQLVLKKFRRRFPRLSRRSTRRQLQQVQDVTYNSGQTDFTALEMARRTQNFED